MRSRTILWALALLAISTSAAIAEDPYLWLEEVDGEKALAWVEEQSAKGTAALEAVPEFEGFHEKLIEIYNSADRIPYASIRGEWVYNYWQDAEHVRGIWRRTTLDEYVTDSPDWQTILDLDALGAEEDENWVWKGASFLPPDNQLAMVTLSRGGGDASVRREFDLSTGEFVEGGFFVPEAKARVSWKDENTLWIGTDFGESSMTTSGYPRLVKEWKRGTSLDEAVTIFEGDVEDVSVSGYSDFTPERRYDLVQKTPAFFKGSYYFNTGDELVQIDIPEDASMYGFFKEHMLVNLRSDWEVGGNTYPSDALLAIDFDQFMDGARDFRVLFEPEDRVAFGSLTTTKDHLIYSTMDNVNGKVYRVIPDKDWKREEIPMPGLGTVGIGSASDDDNKFFFTYTDFVTPSSLYLVDAGTEPKQVKTTPEWFDSTGMDVVQFEATSKDGTKIPYFVFKPAGFEANGTNPTLLYGYGGFEISMRPRYSATTGYSWVSRGGVYVLANIRGGGEFGPKWHEAAMQAKHQTNFDDFIAVAEDLIARDITSPDYLGIAGGSQGGLLVGGTFTQRPELFKAVVCQVPLLDMKRYNKLLAGASWMAEYGNPDTEDWDNYMKYWSPYQNLDPDKDYPQVFFTTSTRDDRVHPGHARKMVAKMLDMGKPVYYYENTEGGHSAAANLNQRAYMWALTYSYLWKMLGEEHASR